VDSIPDVVASTANNLKKDGWVSGQTWGYEVVVPTGFDFLLADRSRVLTVREWERLGIRRPGGKAFPRGDDRTYLLVPAGAPRAATTWASPMAGSAARPAARCATSNPRSGRCPTGSPRRRSWSGCGADRAAGGIFKLTFFGYIPRQNGAVRTVAAVLTLGR